VIEQVKLSVPAKPPALSLARLTVASLASQAGFHYDEIEDLRLAIQEMCLVLIGAEGRAGVVELQFIYGQGSIEVEASFEGPGIAVDPSDLSRQILEALVDEFKLTDNEDGARRVWIKRQTTSMET